MKPALFDSMLFYQAWRPKDKVMFEDHTWRTASNAFFYHHKSKKNRAKKKKNQESIHKVSVSVRSSSKPGKH